ncbi:MAG: helix-turn-helix domain-containing protein [candidate division WOR-3 bacterium]|nr:helix-turn-helix domain-containing protein [candidate division WOR-3 bacterium]
MMDNFIKHIIAKLKNLRKSARLTQNEVAQRMKLKPKSGQSFVARLENGKIKNPSLLTVLNYLDAIGVNWGTFFRELSSLRSKQEHTRLISQVKLPSDAKLQKKLDRDIFLYQTKIQPPQRFYPKVDLDLVKQKVTLKVKKLCQNLQIKPALIPHYLNFACEVIKADKILPVIEKYKGSGISDAYLSKITSVALKTLRAEEKKVQKQKPLARTKVRAMAEKYLQARIKLAEVESAVSKILAQDIAPDNVWFNSYMNYARECYRYIRRLKQKNPSLLKQHLKQITDAWLRNGLKLEIMEKIKETVLKLSESQNKS